jgi:hypothetical protein
MCEALGEEHAENEGNRCSCPPMVGANATKYLGSELFSALSQNVMCCSITIVRSLTSTS